MAGYLQRLVLRGAATSVQRPGPTRSDLSIEEGFAERPAERPIAPRRVSPGARSEPASSPVAPAIPSAEKPVVLAAEPPDQRDSSPDPTLVGDGREPSNSLPGAPERKEQIVAPELNAANEPARAPESVATEKAESASPAAGPVVVRESPPVAQTDIDQKPAIHEAADAPEIRRIATRQSLPPPRAGRNVSIPKDQQAEAETLSIGSIHIDMVPPAASAPPAPERTRGFDAYARARLGLRR